MEGFYVALGLFAVYIWIHFTVVQFTKKWSERSTWEQVVTIFAIVFLFLTVLGNA